MERGHVYCSLIIRETRKGTFATLRYGDLAELSNLTLLDRERECVCSCGLVGGIVQDPAVSRSLFVSVW